MATVLKENKPMLRVFEKRYPNAKVDESGDLDTTIIMDFSLSHPKHTTPASGNINE